MYYVYIIKSLSTNRFYTGYTGNLKKRLYEHNSRKTKSLRNQGPFKLIYKEEYINKQDAYKRERQIKSYKSGEAFKKLVGHALKERASHNA